MNTYPDNVTQQQLDAMIFSDGVYELACIEYKTHHPTQDQLEEIQAELEREAEYPYYGDEDL